MKRVRKIAAVVLLSLATPAAHASEPPDAGGGTSTNAPPPPAAANPTPEPAKRATLRIEAKAFRGDSGRARFALFRSKDGYPGKFAKALKVLAAEIRDGRATARFEGLEPGVYAIAVHHDENANDKVDTNWIGIPNEGLGVSNDARGSFGPPGFDDAKFELPPAGKTIVLTIVYL